MPPERAAPPSTALRQLVGQIDIYLFDQILRGRFDGCRRVLDAGCGSGRNLVWFLGAGYDVSAIDGDESAVAAVRSLYRAVAPALPPDNVRRGRLEALPWPDGVMDAVLSSAVLHFAADDGHFDAMLEELWRVLAPGGMLFVRLASSIGLEGVLPRTTGRVRLPDGSDRYVVSEADCCRGQRSTAPSCSIR